MAEALAWYAALQAASLAAWPLVARALGALPDRGWAASKVAGLLLVGWLSWLLGMLTPLPYARGTILLLLAATAVVSWGWVGRSETGRALARWPLSAPRLAVAWEAVFLVAFVFFALLRAYDPAIRGTEKPMDMAFLAGFISAERLPTQDTWLAGYGVPYYYFGYFLFATLAKLSGARLASPITSPRPPCRR